MRGFLRSPARANSACLLALVGVTALPHAASADDARDWLSKALAQTSSSNGYGGLGMGGGAGGKAKSKGTQVASLAGSAPQAAPSLSGGGKINWSASSSCLNGQLAGVISAVAAAYGSVTVSSTCRSHSHNAAVGGAKQSLHLSGDAADFRVHGNWGAAYSYLQSVHGGMVKHYGGGLFHIDAGAKGRF